jgi:glycerol-3-phosphate O-acyltransferase
VRRLGRRYGEIHIRFGEPISLAKSLGRPDPAAEPAPDERSLAVRKLAFEVCVRINRVTPITPSSLVALALLGSGFRALSVDEAVTALRNILRFVRTRGLPTTGELDLDDAEGVRRALDALVENGVVSRFAEGPEPVYRIGPEQQLAAAYYRNSVLHFFVTAAVAELALLRAAEEGVAEPLSEFWAETLRVRDLLKFEFFFAEKDVYRREMREELAVHDAAWEEALAGGPAAIGALVRRIRPFSAHRVLKPFLEAYRVVAEALVARGDETGIEEPALLSRCLAIGKQYHLQRRISSPESISKVLFETALKLARNRGLLDPDVPSLGERRRAFAAEINDAIRRVDVIDALAASRRAGLID